MLRIHDGEILANGDGTFTTFGRLSSAVEVVEGSFAGSCEDAGGGGGGGGETTEPELNMSIGSFDPPQAASVTIAIESRNVFFDKGILHMSGTRPPNSTQPKRISNADWLRYFQPLFFFKTPLARPCGDVVQLKLR